MGADFRADENGTFELILNSYDTFKFIGIIKIEGLEPNEGIYIESMKGWKR